MTTAMIIPVSQGAKDLEITRVINSKPIFKFEVNRFESQSLKHDICRIPDSIKLFEDKKLIKFSHI